MEELGKGAMGRVYKVRSPEKKILALKLLFHSKEKDQIGQRFLREIKILSNIRHPNIVKLFDCGEWKGQSFYVMEYLEGINLCEHINQNGKMNLRKASQIMYKISQAVQKLHENGIIHRDIKPANIMLVKNKPYLMDFGVAYDSNEARLTFGQNTVGTPNYMAPEQLNPDLGPLGVYSDVYSIGASLYHLLAGVMPFKKQIYIKGIIGFE